MRHPHFVFLVAALVAIVSSPGPAALGQCESARFQALDADPDDRFGNSLSVFERTALVGSPADDGSGAEAGAAWVFQRGAGRRWLQTQKLSPSDPAPDQQFGRAVALEGNFAVIGAPGAAQAGTNSGAVYLFRFNGSVWIETFKFVAPDGQARDRFGTAVALRDGVVVVGASKEDQRGRDAGAVYVFHRVGDSWFPEAKLVAGDGAAGDRFGRAVAIRGDVILIAAPGHDASGAESGAAYLFGYDGASWIVEQKLIASDGQAGDEFGASVALQEGLALVGADQSGNGGPGAAYLVRRSGGVWAEEGRLGASGGAPGDGFGASVALSGDVALVGAATAGHAGLNAGCAWLFRGDAGTWNQEALLSPSDAEEEDRFGWAVAAHSGHALVSAPTEDTGAQNAGTVYVWLYEESGGPGAHRTRGQTVPQGARWTNYGQGWPGTSGIPDIELSDDPVIGTTVLLQIGNSRGFLNTGILFVGLSPLSQDSGLGGTLLVAPSLLFPLAVPGSGLNLPITIHCNNGLEGIPFYLQATQIDVGASDGMSFTPGLELIPGRF